MHSCPRRLCGFVDVRTRSGRRIVTRLDASLSGVRTTRLLRPRTSWLSRRGPMCAPPAINQAAVKTAVRPASRVTQRVLRPCHRTAAPALPRPPHPGPHLVTIAKRPSGRAGMDAHAINPKFGKVEYFCREVLTGCVAALRRASSGVPGCAHAGRTERVQQYAKQPHAKWASGPPSVIRRRRRCFKRRIRSHLTAARSTRPKAGRPVIE